MNSVYLETFRRRKNALLASEINFDEMGMTPDANMSGNSVYLETFRRRKNKLLASELNISDNTLNTAVNDAPVIDRSPQKPPLKEESGFSWNDEEQRALSGVRFHSLGRSTIQIDSDDLDFNDAFDSDIDFSDDFSSVNYDAPAKSADSFSPERSGFTENKAGTPSKPEHKAPSVRSKSQSKSKPVGNDKNDKNKKRNAKVAIALSVLAIAVCGFVLISKMNKDTETIEEQDIPVFSETESTTGSAESDEVYASTAAVVSTTAATTKSTTESSAETTTTTAARDLKALRPGAENDDVLRMQKRLAELGYITEESCTGYYGEYTKKHLKQFQENAGLKQTGIADGNTLKRLYADDAPRR